MPKTPQTEHDCVDTNEMCADWKDMGLCTNNQHTSYEGVIAKECRKTCNLCEENEPCHDLFSPDQCSEYVNILLKIANDLLL